jgi:hypothetical protein
VIGECPICYGETAQNSYYMDGWCLEEATEKCRYGCYDYHYAYGGSELYITINGHHILFHWNYSDSPEESKSRTEAIDIVTKTAQRALVEQLRFERRHGWMHVRTIAINAGQGCTMNWEDERQRAEKELELPKLSVTLD